MLNDKQLELLKKQTILVLTTSDMNNQPHAIFVEINKIENGSLIITDNHMEQTISNIKINNKVFVLAYSKDYSLIINIDGLATYHDSGALLEYAKNNPDNEGYYPKGVIEVKITAVNQKHFDEDFES
ncbi:MAG: pyridoxamine 5'-phosphate oxidase family protein [Candidatus Berkelbacteria bacterium]